MAWTIRPTWRVSWFAPLVGLLVAALWAGLDAIAPAASPRAIAPATAATGAVMRALTAVLVVPLIEELAFRGFLARRVSRPSFEAIAPQEITAAGVAVSSAAFGLLHSHPLAGALAGLAYALAYRARGRLADAIVAHAVTNAALVVAFYATGGAIAGP